MLLDGFKGVELPNQTAPPTLKMLYLRTMANPYSVTEQSIRLPKRLINVTRGMILTAHSESSDK